MWFKLYTTLVIIVYYPVYLSILAVDKIKDRLGLNQFMLKDVVVYVAISAVSIACLGILALLMLRDEMKDVDVGPFD